MQLLTKALWFIESHFAEEIALDDVAAVSGVSRFHLSRAFQAGTGISVMRYVRGRRLSEAARALAGGAPDILSLALDAGYGSHEAFTRAFRDQFGMTPEQVRAKGDLSSLALVEPTLMRDANFVSLNAPRYEEAGPMLIAGPGARFGDDTKDGIPALWQRFGAALDAMDGKISDDVSYGVCHNDDGSGHFDYIAGVEVKDFGGVPDDLARVRLARQRYAVFSHGGHVASVRSTFHTIWSDWFPKSGHKMADAPLFERYGPEFDPATGNGGLEIWIPLKA